MKPLEAREGSEVVNGSVTVWRPWQLKQFELFQAVTVSTSSRQQFTQEYLIISGQSGTVSSFQYRNAPASGHIAEGKLLVIEPGETWTSQIKDMTSQHLFIDPAWLQQFDAWLEHVRASQIREFQGFVVRIERDKAAVVAGLTLPQNNGLVEGQVNRLKLIKRQMYGRANFDLLRLRVLHHDVSSHTKCA